MFGNGCNTSRAVRPFEIRSLTHRQGNPHRIPHQIAVSEKPVIEVSVAEVGVEFHADASDSVKLGAKHRPEMRKDFRGVTLLSRNEGHCDTGKKIGRRPLDAWPSALPSRATQTEDIHDPTPLALGGHGASIRSAGL